MNLNTLPKPADRATGELVDGARPQRRGAGRLQLSQALLEVCRGHDQVQTPAQTRPRKIRTELTIGDIVDQTGAAGFGFLTALMALISLLIPGFSVVGGLALALGAVQMIAGMTRPWLPGMIRRHKISLRTLRIISGKLVRWTGWMERLVRPRFEFLTRGLLWRMCGVCILIQAVGLALPLPIPWTNSLFAIPIVLYAIGLLEADGLLVMFCHGLTVVEIGLCIKFWPLIVKGGQALLHWFGM